MGTALGLASAACYGIADVAGGLLARRVNFAVVALVGQAAAFVLVAAAAVAVPAQVGPADLGSGALSGVGTGLGMAFLYRGLARGAMSVVVPVSAVGGLAIPVAVGVALFGDRPTPLAVLGMVVAVPALWLVSGGRARVTSAAVDGLLASLGIALQYLALAAAGPAAGIWPVAAGRLAAVLAIAPLLARTGPGVRPPARHLFGAALAGGFAALALVTYLLATRQQLVSITVVLSSLYPVIPVLFGLTALRERLGLGQALGLAGAGAAVVLLSL